MKLHKSIFTLISEIRNLKVELELLEEVSLKTIEINDHIAKTSEVLNSANNDIVALSELRKNHKTAA